ncbi:nicotinate-nucleotide adenylyltransferase [Candidatus Latescibacterota bacterium]
MKKIGLFGGTFDPVHTGHLIIAQSVRESLGIASIIFIPSARPPHKNTDIMFTPEERYSMLSAALEGNPHFLISDIEMKRQGPSYTIDTIKEIKSTVAPNTEIYFIVGRDNLIEISSWKEPHSIIEETRILAADRPGHEDDTIPGWLMNAVKLVHTPLIDISSSDIRARIREGKSIRYLVPDAVYKLIENVD